MKIKALIATLKVPALVGLSMIAGTHGGVAHANNYAVSYTVIDDFSLTLNGQLNPFTFSTDVAVQGLGADANVGTTDAPGACVGAFCSAFNNSFVAHGTGGDYAYGDALIGSGNVLQGTGSASSIGEISSGPTGFASGTNSMIASFQLFAPGTVSFAFNATPYMQVTGDGNAWTSMSISIAKGLDTVFTWAPNGALGSGIIGGLETADSHNLNFGIGLGAIYNPTIGNFAATTNSLGAGVYSLTISMSNHVNALTPVPEPETWGMLLAGLGLVALRVCRKARDGKQAA